MTSDVDTGPTDVSSLPLFSQALDPPNGLILRAGETTSTPFESDSDTVDWSLVAALRSPPYADSK